MCCFGIGFSYGSKAFKATPAGQNLGIFKGFFPMSTPVPVISESPKVQSHCVMLRLDSFVLLHISQGFIHYDK